MSQTAHEGDHAAGTHRYTKQEQEPATDVITEIAPGVLRTQLPVKLPGLGHVNCYLLEDERGIAVIDPGLPGPDSWKALVARLDAAGYGVRNVHTAIITHSHFDHFGGAKQLREEAGSEVLTHESFRSAFDLDELNENPDTELDINNDEDFAKLRDRFTRKTPWGTRWRPPDDEDLRRMFRHGRGAMFLLPEPSIRVVDAQVVRLARRDWIAVHTPGHTGDHLCLFDPEHGLFVSGDHVLPTITPHIAGVTLSADPLAAFFASLQRMHDFEVTTVLPAHGHPFHDLAGRADDIARHHDERLDILRKVGRTELHLGTVPEFMRYLFKERAWGDMAESETFAHLEHLRMLGEATVTEVDGLMAYAISD